MCHVRNSLESNSEDADDRNKSHQRSSHDVSGSRTRVFEGSNVRVRPCDDRRRTTQDHVRFIWLSWTGIHGKGHCGPGNSGFTSSRRREGERCSKGIALPSTDPRVGVRGGGGRMMFMFTTRRHRSRHMPNRDTSCNTASHGGDKG